MVKEVRRIEKVIEVKDLVESRARVAAFFDLDGTLLALPSLERRFFQTLRFRRAIPLKSYFLWMREALRLLPRGFDAVVHANKMYLRGVTSLNESDAENRDAFSAHVGGRPARLFAERGVSQAGGQASATPPKRVRRNPRLPVPRFFQHAVERAAWHASQGDAIVIVSGTIEPLARSAAGDLETALAARGFVTAVRVCATKLEEWDGRWTGRIVGEAMFGAAKARAVKGLADELQLDLRHSYAYGDSAHDEAMLAKVGNPGAVNPSGRLARLARKRGWHVLCWKEGRGLTQRLRVRKEAMKQEDPASPLMFRRAEPGA